MQILIFVLKSIEAAEDDGDFEGAEDEAPEAVQAMGGSGNWVFPGNVAYFFIFNFNFNNFTRLGSNTIVKCN